MNHRRPRIAITPDALRAARVLAALEGLEPSDYLSALVLREGSSVLGDLRSPRSPPEAPEEEIKPKGTHKHRPTIKSQPELTSKLEEMKEKGATYPEMAKATGYPEGTIKSYFYYQKNRA